jgi:hypothetical protein
MSNEWASKMQDQLAANEDFDPDQDYFLAMKATAAVTAKKVPTLLPKEKACLDAAGILPWAAATPI